MGWYRRGALLSGSGTPTWFPVLHVALRVTLVSYKAPETSSAKWGDRLPLKGHREGDFR